jgi:hypothetical protein
VEWVRCKGNVGACWIIPSWGSGGVFILGHRVVQRAVGVEASAFTGHFDLCFPYLDGQSLLVSALQLDGICLRADGPEYALPGGYAGWNLFGDNLLPL